MHDRNRISALAREVETVREFVARGLGPVHLLGIGGVGVAGVATMLQARGLRVSGCDGSASPITACLQSIGIPVAIGHDVKHLDEKPAWLVRSPAVRDEEPELRAARAAGIPVFPRGVVLPALLNGLRSIAVSGAHGKTTTTAMIAQVLRSCGIDASFCVGGVVGDNGSVAVAGRDSAMVVEADESDGTVALYSPDIAIVTNIELDHVDYFESETQLHDCFRQFGEQSKLVVFNADDAGARKVYSSHPVTVTFGLEGGRWRAENIVESAFGISFTCLRDGAELGRVELAVPGRHNVYNALAALVVADQFALKFSDAAAALASFRTVRRRFDILSRSASRIVISDYAHHPTEIRALMKQAEKLPCKRILAVFQPHRFTRTAAMGAEFARSFGGVDYLVLAPTYAAFEDPVPGGGIRDLATLFESANHVSSWCADSLLAAWEHIRDKWQDGDALLVVGAGDVEKIAFWARDHLNQASR